MCTDHGVSIFGHIERRLLLETRPTRMFALFFFFTLRSLVYVVVRDVLFAHQKKLGLNSGWNDELCSSEKKKNIFGAQCGASS